MTVLDSQRELMAAALKYLGYSVNDADEEHWKQAMDLIVRAKPYWAAFSNTSYIKELAVGNLWAGARLFQRHVSGCTGCKKNGPRIHYRILHPEGKGAVLALDSMVLHRSGNRPDLAHQFINFMLDGKNPPNLPISSAPATPIWMPCSISSRKSPQNKAIFPDAESAPGWKCCGTWTASRRRLLSRLWTEIKLR